MKKQRPPIGLGMTMALGFSAGWAVLIGIGLFIFGLMIQTLWIVLVGAGLVWAAYGTIAWLYQRAVDDDE